MTSLHIGNNSIPIENMNEIIAIVEAKPAMKVLCAVPFRDKTITELDVSGQNLGVEGALVVGRYLQNNGALTSVNILKNHIEDEGLPAMEAALKESKALKSICGAIGQELDLSGQHLGAEDAKVVAIELKYNRALSSLDLSDNTISPEHMGSIERLCDAKQIALKK